MSILRDLTLKLKNYLLIEEILLIEFFLTSFDAKKAKIDNVPIIEIWQV